MKNKILLTIGLLIVIGSFYKFLNSKPPVYVKPIEIFNTDYKKIDYVVSGQRIKLGGEIFNYFGNEVKTDLDKDGRMDTVFLITQKIDNGLRFFVVGALDTPKGYIGTNAMMVGDNIAPQTTELSQEAGKTGQIIINFAERNAGESATTSPSMGKSIWIKYDPINMDFGEVVQNFEGESK